MPGYVALYRCVSRLAPALPCRGHTARLWEVRVCACTEEQQSQRIKSYTTLLSILAVLMECLRSERCFLSQMPGRSRTRPIAVDAQGWWSSLREGTR